MERDDDVRAACFAALDVLQAKWGPDIPYHALAEGFNVRGRKIPFLNRAYGICRAADAQRGPAALSVNSSFSQQRYRDEETPDGILYRYQDGPIETISTDGCDLRMFWTSRSSTYSGRDVTGIDPNIRRLSRGTSRSVEPRC
jgi:hypothetical protein